MKRASVARRLLASVALVSVWAGLVTSKDAQALEPRRTSDGHVVRWASSDVDFAIDPSVNRIAPGASATVGLAARAWSGQAGAPAVVTAAGDGSMRPGFDGRNGIFFEPNGSAATGAALAVTVLSYDDKTGKILDSDIIVNGKYTFAVLKDGQAAKEGVQPVANDGNGGVKGDAKSDDVFDLPHVLAHELGHTLGLVDEPDQRAALMYRYTAPGDASRRAPSELDLAVISDVYGPAFEAGQAPAGGCGGASVAPHGERANHTRYVPVAMAAFGLVTLGRRRLANRRPLAAGALALAALSAVPNIAHSAPEHAVLGHARARVARSETVNEGGIFRTRLSFDTGACRVGSCPKSVEGEVWGGTLDGIAQVVGEQIIPDIGSTVEVMFAKLVPLRPSFLPSPAEYGRWAGTGSVSIVPADR